MKRTEKILTLFIFFLTLLSFAGCGKNSTDTGFSASPAPTENEPVTEALQDNDEFQLIQSEITLECGTQLSQNLEDYVSGNTENLISSLDGMPTDGRIYYNVPGTYWLEIKNLMTDQVERMKVTYIDTTPPTVTYDTDIITIYCLRFEQDNVKKYQSSLPDGYEFGRHPEDWIISLCPIFFGRGILRYENH